jgi:hypothetical protein
MQMNVCDFCHEETFYDCKSHDQAKMCAGFIKRMETASVGDVIQGMTSAVIARLDESDRARLVELKNEIDDATTALVRINAIVEKMLKPYSKG